MKQLMTFILLAATISLITSCGRSGTSKKARMVTLPFDVTATCNYTYVGPDTLPVPRCEAPLNIWRAIVDGKGTGTPVGDFTVHFDFCGDSISNYGNVDAFMALSDGDTLFVSGAGRVFDGRLDDHPAYVVSYWRDPFVILGGTGKYRGATGNLTTDDYNSSEDQYSHHHWTGTITMMKGK
jgi:hypothetical protein